MSMRRRLSLRTVARQLSRLATDCRGATAVEYGLILALIFLAMVGAISGVANSTIGMWNEVSSKVKGAS